MFKGFFKISLKVTALVIASLAFSHCGQQGAMSGFCGANVVGTKMALSVTRISGSTYKMTLCNNMQDPAPYTVYGANDASLLTPSNLNASAKRQQTLDAFEAGSNFSVTFHSTDKAFAIYYDQDVGGTYQPSNLVGAALEPHSLP